jgi:hypothetical protein
VIFSRVYGGPVVGVGVSFPGSRFVALMIGYCVSACGFRGSIFGAC